MSTTPTTPSPEAGKSLATEAAVPKEPAVPAEGDEEMRATLSRALSGDFALMLIRGVVLPLTMVLLGWVATELVSMRDGVRDLQSAAREMRAQVMDIRDEAKVAMKEAEVYRRQSAESDGKTQTRLNALEQSVKTLGDQVFMIFRKSQLGDITPSQL